jgi:hypothetical protein
MLPTYHRFLVHSACSDALAERDPFCDRSYKDFYALDIYKETDFDRFLEFVHSQQRWRCHSCGQWLKGLAVNVHQCGTKAETDAVKLNAAGLVRPSGN